MSSPVEPEARPKGARYASKPAEVEAMRWKWPRTSSVQDYSVLAQQIVQWVQANGGEARFNDAAITDPPVSNAGFPNIAVRTINGWSHATLGHYVVMGTATFCVHGDDHDGFCRRDFYPCDPGTFESRWERVS